MGKKELQERYDCLFKSFIKVKDFKFYLSNDFSDLSIDEKKISLILVPSRIRSISKSSWSHELALFVVDNFWEDIYVSCIPQDIQKTIARVMNKKKLLDGDPKKSVEPRWISSQGSYSHTTINGNIYVSHGTHNLSNNGNSPTNSDDVIVTLDKFDKVLKIMLWND